jgi:hypothetical protein
LNNPRDSPAGAAGWFVNPFGSDPFPETPPPLAPGLLPEVDIRQFQACAASCHFVYTAMCFVGQCSCVQLCAQQGQNAGCLPLLQGYLNRQAVAYEHFQAVRADDGDSLKASLSASGAPSSCMPCDHAE